MPELVVATFNIHGGVDGWGRPFDAAAACRRLGADVLVVEEVWCPDAGPGLVEELAGDPGVEVRTLPMAPGRLRPPPPGADGRWGPRWPHRATRGLRALAGRDDQGDGAGRAGDDRGAVRGTIGLALVSSLPIRRIDKVDLGRMPGDRSRRGALVAEIDVAGRPLLVAATHMSHLRQGSLLQLQRLRRALPPPDATAAALIGDMNLWGPPLTLLLPGWRRAVRARTWPAWRPIAQSDHVLVTPPVEVRTGETVRVGNSDHLAVRATLVVP